MYLWNRKNKGDFTMKKEQFTLRFEGENDIELETLSSALNSTVSAMKGLSEKLIDENEFCKIMVKNIEPGSFKVIIETIIQEAYTMLPHIPSLVSGIKAILELRKALNGVSPKSITYEGDIVNVENNYGTIIHIDNSIFDAYTSSDKIEKAFSNISDIVAKDTTRKGLEITFNEEGKEESSVHMNKEELLNTSKSLDVTSFSKDFEETISTLFVKIAKPDLVGDTKWTVYRETQRITCDILDAEFLNFARNGIILFKGKMLMKVEMLSRYKVKSDGMPDVREKPVFKILKVLEIEIDGKMKKVDEL